MLAWDVESVNHTIRDVLLTHSLYHTWYDDTTCRIVDEQLFLFNTRSQLTLHLFGPHRSQLSFIGLGIIVVLVADEALAVAHHPHLTIQTTEDDGRTSQAIFWMLSQTGQHRLLIMFVEVSSDTRQELFAGGRLRHATDITLCQLHSIAPIGAQQAMAILTLRGAAVDYSDEVICDDDAVLAFLLWVLGNEILLDNFHVRYSLCTRRNTGAGPTSQLANGP